MKHGTVHAYKALGCRCEDCREANRQAQRDYQRGRRARAGASIRHTPDRSAIRELLLELCPNGLTDDCPARRTRAHTGDVRTVV